ncbi:MAG: DNA mismatch repair protein MutS [Myxococcota bacterium]
MSTPESYAAHPAAQTPMMQQYLAAKTEHRDAIVLFRMGDFYETFFDDAVDCARLLELTLTSRNKKDADPIPMAGVPHHALWSYVPRLLNAGRRVAVCEQVEDPRTAKGIVRREVVQVITPGVVFDPRSLDGPQNNFLASVARDANGAVGVGWIDVSTGERRGADVADMRLALDELGRVEPTEIVVAADDADLQQLLTTALPGVLLSPLHSEPRASDGGLGAAMALLEGYLARTRLDRRLPLRPLEAQDLEDKVRLGHATIRNLELLRTLGDGKRRGSLLGMLDLTRTAMGGRRLKQWLLYPLLDPGAISQRLDRVQAFVDDPITRTTVRSELDAVHDLERLVTRAAAGTATPRDLVALANSLDRIGPLRELLTRSGSTLLSELAATLDPMDALVGKIRGALVDEPPPAMKDGGVIREGHHPELDTLIGITRDGKAWFAQYAETLKAETGISSLKIRFNNVFGYFIEVTKANLEHVPDTWLRKQTLANAERYYTPALKEREEAVLGAHDRRIALETELFEALRLEIASFATPIQSTATSVADLDVLASLAELAQRHGYVRPIVDDGPILKIEAGRHPVIETLVAAGEFVPNDTILDADGERILVITGPNMAGKSTVMRQVALIVLMAQMGSFVPAASAHIGIVDKIFTRVGASDNLSKGLSTFMVEMTEAAEILKEATRRSLVILDEIGRGTSTYDGVSIAWAVAEFLHDEVGARTLFATHYHELTELSATREGVVNLAVAVKQFNDEIVFLRHLVPGGTSRSYGIQVARLAGVPKPVIGRAKAILKTLEATALGHDGRSRLAAAPKGPWQMNLFGGPAAPSEVESRLSEIDPDELTPRKALELIYELAALMPEPDDGG